MKPCLHGQANIEGAYKTEHPCRLSSAFGIRRLEIIIYKLATREISIFYLVSVAAETCLSLAFTGNREYRFCCVDAQLSKATVIFSSVRSL